MDMKEKGLCPVIAFHLDTFMALNLFKELLKVRKGARVSPSKHVVFWFLIDWLLGVQHPCFLNVS